MNPLSDWFVEAAVIAEHQQRLLDSVAYRHALPDGAMALRTMRRWSRRLYGFARLVSTLVAPPPRVSCASSVATLARVPVPPRVQTPSPARTAGHGRCRLARRRCA
jgi:hypothetical protein